MTGDVAALVPMPTARRIESVATLADARADWQALEHRTDNVYSTWDWADAWWREYGDGREQVLHAVYRGDRLAALLPLYRDTRAGVPLLRLIGHGPADELGPVCDPADLALAADGLRAAVRTALPRHGFLLLDRLSGDGRGLPGLDGEVVRQEPTPVLYREGRTWEEWLAGRSANMRQQLRRRERRLLEDHGLRYRLCEDPDRLDRDLTTLFRLHADRWAAGESTAFSPSRQRFHRDFARRALEQGRLRLWIAEADRRPVAAWYGFRFAQSEWYYQAGRDPRWDRMAVGTVLLAHTIRSAFEDGVTAYRFGVGDEPYKDRFGVVDAGLQTLVVGRPAMRMLAAALARGVSRLPGGARRALARRLA